ncbi:MAG TPA: Gfo/Idh/MocA family oxidoreductase [Gammaproteobacteria bacterium]|nr:Gfo/Idh/MocA family oxidoreductase [Gammaproteobacteria bacterium]
MSQTVRTGVLGVGALGRYHAQKYAGHEGATLVGVFDPDRERAESVAAEVGCPAFTEVDALLREVDAVTIAAPTEAHRELGEAAFAAGVHVLMEKPIAGTREDADRLLAAADQAGRVLQVGHLKRFHPGVRWLAEKGWDRQAPRYLEANRLNTFQPRSLDIDVIQDLMVHDLDLILNWVRAPVAEVRALGIPVVTDKVDMANARIAFANGTVANVTASRVASKRIREIRMFQFHRYASVDFVDNSLGLFELDEDAEEGPVPGARGAQEVLEKRDLLADEVDAFLTACRGEPSLGATGAEGRDALDLGLQVRAAIDDHFQRYGDAAFALQETQP